MYADDLVKMTESKQELQALDEWKEMFKKHGLMMMLEKIVLWVGQQRWGKEGREGKGTGRGGEGGDRKIYIERERREGDIGGGEEREREREIKREGERERERERGRDGGREGGREGDTECVLEKEGGDGHR